MWVVFMLSATVFAIILMLLAWIGNKILNSIRKDNYNFEKSMEEKEKKE